MEWEGREESQNVEDRRGFSRGTGIAIGGVGSIIVVILALFLGVDPQKLLGPGQGGVPGQPNPQAQADPEEERQLKFTKVILGDTERVWTDLFARMGKRYPAPTLVVFNGQVDSACGMADSAVGPFYCPGDSKVYIDLSFYRDMERKLNAPGEFARAYVIAHEVGHHVQRLLGYSRNMDEARRSGDDRRIHQTSVRLELQADYFAGVWAHHGQEKFHFLEPGDMKSALNAAFQIGDDRLQKKARGRVGAGLLHARHLRATHALVQERFRHRRRGQSQAALRATLRQAVSGRKKRTTDYTDNTDKEHAAPASADFPHLLARRASALHTLIFLSLWYPCHP